MERPTDDTDIEAWIEYEAWLQGQEAAKADADPAVQARLAAKRKAEAESQVRSQAYWAEWEADLKASGAWVEEAPEDDE